MGKRMFLAEGVLNKNKSGKLLTAFLFNDFLLLCSAKSGIQKLGLYRLPLLLSELLVREAVKVLNKDQGSLDSSCFQLLCKDDIITLRANSSSERKRWVKDIDDAITKHKAASLNIKPVIVSKKDTIGTLKLSLLDTKNMEASLKKEQIFCVLQLDDQIIRSQKRHIYIPFNQAVMFSVSSLDHNIKITLCRHSEYSSDGNLYMIIF